ncbi:MAG TPA: discoidin domain-containing protein, partial [Ignavibacteriaceae bacterium]|nr:discoidin domain-containing protein [Ignavibacteriaceae bacterium]
PQLTGYMPNGNSNAVDHGAALNSMGYNHDITGLQRPEGNGWDIGAAEFPVGGGGNNPPNQPTNPGPSNGALNQPINSTLSWSGSDPNGDPLTYDVYFGAANNPPLVSGNQSGTNYDPGTLNTNTTYYWKIVAKDNQGATTAGPVWNFSTEAIGGGGDTTPPELTGTALSGTNTVLVTFSEEMDSLTILNKNNYSINNGITVNTVFVLCGCSKVILSTSDHMLGSWYELTVNNVKDVSGNLINQASKTLDYHATEKMKFDILQAQGQWYQNLIPQKAIDGNPDTTSNSRWGGVVNLPDSIVFDLGDVKTIDETRFSFYRWNDGRVYNYSVLTSHDGKNWAEVVSNKPSAPFEWSIDAFSPVEARYVKLEVLRCNESQFAGLWEAEILGSDNLTGVENGNKMPSEYKLAQNYPNPFNPTTTINFDLPSDQQVKVNIYNTLGELVKELANNFYTAGSHSLTFNAANLPSGVYIYRLESKAFNTSKKMILMK